MLLNVSHIILKLARASELFLRLLTWPWSKILTFILLIKIFSQRINKISLNGVILMYISLLTNVYVLLDTYSYPSIYQSQIYRVLHYKVPLCVPLISCSAKEHDVLTFPQFTVYFCLPPRSTVNWGMTVIQTSTKSIQLVQKGVFVHLSSIVSQNGNAIIHPLNSWKYDMLKLLFNI